MGGDHEEDKKLRWQEKMKDMRNGDVKEEEEDEDRGRWEK